MSGICSTSLGVTSLQLLWSVWVECEPLMGNLNRHSTHSRSTCESLSRESKQHLLFLSPGGWGGGADVGGVFGSSSQRKPTGQEHELVFGSCLCLTQRTRWRQVFQTSVSSSFPRCVSQDSHSPRGENLCTRGRKVSPTRPTQVGSGNDLTTLELTQAYL